jgi:hypothetical protein
VDIGFLTERAGVLIGASSRVKNLLNLVYAGNTTG